jgi:hypothetical protein
MRRDPRVGLVLVTLGAVVLALAVVDARTPWRPILTLAFFCVAPGAAIVPHLRISDPLLAAALVIAVSVAVGIAAAMGMLWAGVSSPAAGAGIVLAVTALALGWSPAPDREEVTR